jgi:hypothetical protein
MNKLDDLDIVIRRSQGQIIAAIPAVNLYARGETLTEAIESLERKKASLAADLTEVGDLGSAHSHQEWSGERRGRRPRDAGGVVQFALKTAIVMGLAAAATIFVGMVATTRMEPMLERGLATFTKVASQIEGMGKLGGRQFWQKVETALDEAADPRSDLPEEKKQKLLADIRAVATRWRPFIAEGASMFPDAKSASCVVPTDK